MGITTVRVATGVDAWYFRTSRSRRAAYCAWEKAIQRWKSAVAAISANAKSPGDTSTNFTGVTPSAFTSSSFTLASTFQKHTTPIVEAAIRRTRASA